MYMVSMITYFLSVRGFGHPVFLKPHFGRPVMKILAKTLSMNGFSYCNGHCFVMSAFDWLRQWSDLRMLDA